MKITTIGAGSIAWGPAINIDFLSNPKLDGAELMLMDIDADALARVARLLERLVAERGITKTITATTDLTSALRDADYALAAIAVGGDRLWRYDAMFPQIYGIYQPVGDTIGPGGLVRALRHAGPLMNIGRTMLAVSRPGAPLIQLTNPMNPLCAALAELDGLTVYGVCHGVDDTERIFANQLGVAPEQVHVKAAGNNHFIFCTEITVDDETFTQERFPELAPRLFDTPFREEVYRRFGGIVGNHSRHPIEFLPGFLTPEYEYGRAWGVPPLAEQIDPMLGVRHDATSQQLEQALAQREPIAWRTDRRLAGLTIDAEGRAEVGHTREDLDDFIVALAEGGDFFTHLNVANEGAIAGVPAAYNVELPVMFTRGKMTRMPVRFNEAITAEIVRVGREQHLIAQACRAYDEELLIEALSLDALVANRDQATRLVREMVAFQREYMPAA